MITLDEQSLVQQWLEAEKNGEQFPVDFNIAWTMAGYSRKDHAKRRLETELSLGTDFAFLKSGEWTQQGRSSDLIQLTCDKARKEPVLFVEIRYRNEKTTG